MRCRSKNKSMGVVLRFTVGLIMGLFVLGLSNAQNVEGSHSRKGRSHKAKSLNCGDMITSHAVLYNDLECSGSSGVALTLLKGASLNLNGKKLIGNESNNCIEITGDGAKVWNGTVMNCRDGILITGESNEILQVEVRDNNRVGIHILGGSSNEISLSTVNNNSREGVYIEKGNRNRIDQSTVNNNGREGIYIEGGNRNRIDQSTVNNNGREGIYIQRPNSNEMEGGDNNEISRSIVNNNRRQGIHIEGGESNRISRTIVENNARHGIQIELIELENSGGTAGGNNNEISRSTVRGSCRDGIEIVGNKNLVLHNHVEDNGNPQTCEDFGADYNPWAYAGIDVADVVSVSENNKIKYNYACGNQGCNGSESEPCIARDRNLWDEFVDINGNHVLTNEWKNNTVCPDYSPSPEQD